MNMRFPRKTSDLLPSLMTISVSGKFFSVRLGLSLWYSRPCWLTGAVVPVILMYRVVLLHMCMLRGLTPWHRRDPSRAFSNSGHVRTHIAFVPFEVIWADWNGWFSPLLAKKQVCILASFCVVYLCILTSGPSAARKGSVWKRWTILHGETELFLFAWSFIA